MGYCQRNQKGSPIHRIVQCSVVNTSCSHSREVLSLNRRLRSSHAWYRSRSQWLYITGAKIHDSKTRDGVRLRSSSVGEATTTVVALKRPTIRSYNFPLAVTPLRRVKNIIKSIK